MIKKISIFLCLCLAFCAAALADEIVRTISVSGSAERTITPDQITIFIRVVTKNADFDTAKSENLSIADNLIKIAAKYGASEKNVKSENFNVRPEYQRCSLDSISKKRCDPNEITSYHIERRYSVVLNDFALYDDFVISAMDAGLTHIDSIKFGNTKLNKIKEELQVAAATNAKQKATAIVKPLGVKLGMPINIVTENYIPNEPVLYHNNNNNKLFSRAMESAAEVNTLSVGEMKVRSDIDITFQIQ